MALIICSYCNKTINRKWFPNDWKIIKGKNVLCNKVKCNDCIIKGVED